jgi:hypothetical protein
MNSLGLKALLVAAMTATCMTAFADAAGKQDRVDPGQGRSYQTPADTEPLPEQKGADKAKGDATQPAGKAGSTKPAVPLAPDASDLTDEEAEAIRKGTR